MTNRERRILRWGAVVIAVLLTMRTVPRGLRWFAGHHAELESRAAVVARMRAELSGMNALADSVARVRAELIGLDSLLLEAHTDVGAFAEMSLRLRALADRFALDVRETAQEADSASTPPFRRIRIRVALAADSRGLLGALHALATEVPVLTVDWLNVKARDPASNPEVLDVEAALTGWYIDREGGT